PLALSIFEQALRRDPGHPEALRQLAELDLKRNLLRRGTELARRLSAVPGWEARGHWLLAQLLLKQFDPDAAAASFARVLVYAPTAQAVAAPPAVVRKHSARAWLRAGQAGAAHEALGPVLASGPDAEASWLESRAFLQQGDVERARAAL